MRPPLILLVLSSFGACTLAIGLELALACNETRQALTRRRKALRSSCTLLTDAAMQDGVLLVAAPSQAEEEACAPRLLPIESPWFGVGPRPLPVTHMPAAHLQRICAAPAAITKLRAVIVGVSGAYGCRQYGHYLFNLLLPLLDTLQQLNWTGSAAPDTIYIDCHGRGLRVGGVGGGVQLHAAPRFVQEAASAVLGGAISPQLGGAAPLRSLHQLAHASRSRPVCFKRVLVGMGCAQSDHFNGMMPLAPVRAMRSAVLRALVQPVGGDAAPDASEGAVVLLSLRDGDRRILNHQAVLGAILSQPGVDASRSRVVRFGSLSFAEQVRLAGAADVLIGMDGTDLSNGLFLRPSGAVIDLLPYGTDAAVPEKSRNFVRLWRAVGLRIVLVGLRDASRTRVALRTAWCGWCLRNHSLAIAPQKEERGLAPLLVRQRRQRAPCVRTLSDVYSCVLTQDSLVDPELAGALARDAAEYVLAGHRGGNKGGSGPPRAGAATAALLQACGSHAACPRVTVFEPFASTQRDARDSPHR